MKRIVVLLIAVVGLFVAAAWVSRNESQPVPQLTAAVDEAGNLQFTFLGGKVVPNVGTFVIWKEGDPDFKWFVDIDNVPLAGITYGIIPKTQSSAGVRVTQRYPLDNQPPGKLMEGDVFVVSLSFTRDVLFPPTPAGGTKAFRFQRQTGRVDSLTSPTHVVSPRPWPTKKFL